MLEELRFAVRCHGSAKKPKLCSQCSKCAMDGGGGAGSDAVVGVVGEPSPNGVLLAQSVAGAVVPPRQPSVTDDRLHYRRSARLDCDYAVDRRRTSMRCADMDYNADLRPSGTGDLLRPQDVTNKTPPDRFRDPLVAADSLARSFAKV